MSIKVPLAELCARARGGLRVTIPETIGFDHSYDRWEGVTGSFLGGSEKTTNHIEFWIFFKKNFHTYGNHKLTEYVYMFWTSGRKFRAGRK